MSLPPLSLPTLCAVTYHAVAKDREVLESCTLVLESYITLYQQCGIAEDHYSLRQRNQRVQLICLLLEGITHVHQV